MSIYPFIFNLSSIYELDKTSPLVLSPLFIVRRWVKVWMLQVMLTASGHELLVSFQECFERGLLILRQTGKIDSPVLVVLP